jgi:mono/diheme cytochrome c family protein
VGLACGCGTAAPAPSAPELQIVTLSGAPLYAVAGDVVELKVVLVAADGTIQDLPSGTRVSWTSPPAVTALAPESADPSPLPAPGAQPTAAWISNPARKDEPAGLGDTLVVLDPGTVQNGTVQVSATVLGSAGGAGGSPSGDVTATLLVDPTPAGNWTRGAVLYGTGGANCATCHGATGAGSPAQADGTYAIEGETYPFPAPGLNAAPGNTAGDPAWDAALFAVASRVDVDNGGVGLRLPMPNWLTQPDIATGKLLTTQDLADIYAFLRTQTE